MHSSDVAVPTSDVKRKRFPLAVLAAALLAFATLVLWGAASPVGAAPDDDFHMASIWCAAGDKADACEAGETSESRIVPRDVLDVCYAGLAAESAQCQGPDFGDNPDDTVSTVRGNFQNLYPPVFYLAMSPFVSDKVDVSVLIMRAVNSAILVSLVSALVLALPRSRRFAPVAAVVVTSVPLSLFIVSSVNPSSWAVISAATLWAAVLGYFETTGRRRIFLAVLAAASLVIGAGARADAGIFAVLAIGAVTIFEFTPTKRFFVTAIFPVVLVAVALAFYLSAGQSGASSAAGFGALGSGSPSRLTALANVIPNIPFLWAGALGQWGLGWLDTGMYPVVWFCSLGVVLGIVFAGIGGTADKRKSLVLLGLAAALLAIPAVLLIQSQAIVGEFVQPRYLLPLMVIFVGIAVLRRRGSPLSLSRAQLVAMIAALSTAQSIALHTNLRRYVTGVDVSGWNLNAAIEWWWLPVVSPMGVWISATVTFTLMLIVMAAPLWRAGSERGSRIAEGLNVEPSLSSRPTATL